MFRFSFIMLALFASMALAVYISMKEVNKKPRRKFLLSDEIELNRCSCDSASYCLSDGDYTKLEMLFDSRMNEHHSF